MKLNKYYYPAAVIFAVLLLIGAFVPSPSYGKDPIPNNRNRNDKDTVWIFNGKNLSNLELILENKNTDMGNLYNIKNNVLYIKAGNKGYLRTKDKYFDFYLHAEWKWTEKDENGNSGILLFIQPPDTIWPDCIQVNLKAEHAGDLIAMNGADFKEAAGKPKSTAVIFSEASEKPEGEWNSCNVFCMKDSMKVYINGVLQNKASGIINHSGTLGLQLEGKPIAFKNVYLIKK